MLAGAGKFRRRALPTPRKKSWARLIRRVKAMSRDELRVRMRQEIAKRSDFVMSRLGGSFAEGCSDSRASFRGRFFFDSADVPQILGYLRRCLPQVVDEIVHQADQICRHRFDLLGYQGVEYSRDIDWHLDAVHGKRAPRRPWYRVRYLDFDQVGDAKITWELNRHQHLVTLAKAYRLTGRVGYALELFEQWYSWQTQNPYPIGINWASSLEVAFRTLSWLWVSYLLEECSVVPARFPSDLRRALAVNGRHIERFLSTYFSPNTHLLGEAAALFFIGTLSPGSDADAAQRRQKLGWEILLREAQRQVRPDGMHFEHSIYYHVYALDFFVHARVLARRNGIPIPAAFDGTVEKMMEVLCNLSCSGPLPRLGDDDGGRVFDPRRNRPEHMLDPLASGALLFNRSDFKAVAGKMREETVWLLGTDAAERFHSLPGDRPAPASYALEASGIHVMSGAAPKTQQLAINAGPLERGRDGHRHADALSLHLAVNGRPVLIDPGTYAYVDPRDERSRFRGTAGHNTVHIDGLSQAEPDGPFKWHGLPRTRVNRWVNGNTFDFFDGTHDGYGRLADPVQHRRSIFYWKPHFWFVRDVAEGVQAHQISLHWHFAAGTLSPIPGGVTFLGDGKTALSLLFAAGRPWSREICPDWHSPVYGKKETAPLLRLTTKTVLPIEMASLLIPASSTHVGLGILRPLTSEWGSPSPRAYQYCPEGTSSYLFVFADRCGGWRLGPWSSDASFFFCATGREGQPDSFVVCNGSYLALNGRRLLSSRATLRYAEFYNDARGQRFYCSRADASGVDPLMSTAGKRIVSSSPARSLTMLY
jgi:Heparinase II/III-like protein/Heparinase II/III N-terminus